MKLRSLVALALALALVVAPVLAQVTPGTSVSVPNVGSFGAFGDGSDQTTQIRNAITATPEGGELDFPCGNYAISGSGTEVFLRTKPIYLHAAENCVALIVDGVGNSTDIFRFTPNAVTNPYGWRVSGFKVFSAAGTHARDFINFDTSGTNTGIIVFPQVDHNVVLALNGKAVRFNNALPSVNVSGTGAGAGGVVRLTVSSTTGMITGMKAFVAGVGGTTEANGTWTLTVVDSTHIDLTGTNFVNAYTSGGTAIAANATGGTTNGMIGPLNSFQNPITFNFGGDTMRVTKNTLAGTGACIEGQLVIGASGVLVDGANNMSCSGGMLVWDGGASPVLFDNILEQHGTNTESNNCLVDIRGSTRQVDTSVIMGNRITTLAGTGNPTPVCITNANGAQINNNTIVTPSAYAGLTVGASSTNTKIGSNNVFIQAGATVPTNSSTVTDAGTNTEYNIPSTVPLGTSGGVPFFNANGKQATSGLLNANGVLIGGGAGAAPFTTNIATNDQIFFGLTGGTPLFRTVTGACTFSTGVITCGGLLSGTNIWSGTNTFGTVVGTVTTQSGTTYTFAAADCGTTVRFTNAAAVTATIPQGLSVGCSIAVEQAGTGQVAVNGSAVTPATLHSAHSFTKTFGQWAVIGIFTESSNVAILTGDGA